MYGCSFKHWKYDELNCCFYCDWTNADEHHRPPEILRQEMTLKKEGLLVKLYCPEHSSFNGQIFFESPNLFSDELVDLFNKELEREK